MRRAVRAKGQTPIGHTARITAPELSQSGNIVVEKHQCCRGAAQRARKFMTRHQRFRLGEVS
jgi:hypothetical protein